MLFRDKPAGFSKGAFLDSVFTNNHVTAEKLFETLKDAVSNGQTGGAGEASFFAEIVVGVAIKASRYAAPDKLTYDEVIGRAAELVRLVLEKGAGGGDAERYKSAAKMALTYWLPKTLEEALSEFL